MEVKFQKMFDKHWFVFPICVIWHAKLVEYYPPAKGLSLHFLWWHCVWTFFAPRKENKR